MNNIIKKIFFLHFIALFFAVFSNSVFSKTIDNNGYNCIEIVIDKEKKSHKILSKEHYENGIYFLSTDKIYNFESETCFTIINKHSNTKDFSIWLENPRAHHVEIINGENNNTPNKVVTKGIAYPLHLWKTTGAEILFYESLKPNETKKITLRTGSISPYNTRIIFSESNLLPENILYQRIIIAIIAGIILSLIATCLTIGISTREKTYFLICGSTAFVTLLQISDLGILFPLWPNATYWNSISSGIFAVLSPLFGANLARHYLETRTSLPKVDLILRFYSWYLALFCLPVAALQQDFIFLILFGGVSVLIFMPTLVIASIIRIRAGFSPAKIYLAALFMPYISGLSIFLIYAGIIPSTIFTKILPLAGTALQLSLFVAALGERINWLKKSQYLSMQRESSAKSEMAAKKSFLAHTSHELRTPLIGIIGLADLAKNNPIYQKNKLLIDGISTSATTLLDTTNTLLDIARVESGKWNSKQRPFNPQETIEASLRRLREPSRIYKKSISETIYDFSCKKASGDPDIISRIIEEIFKYSINISDKSSIYFTAKEIINKSSNFCIYISATCITSFANKTYQAPFELFSISDASTTREQQGLGLGLSLSKKFCDLIGGEIGYEVGPENSLTIWCSIPFTPAPDTDFVDHSPANDQVISDEFLPASPSRLLLAEDDETLRLILSDQLEKIGANFTLYPNGRPLVEEYRLSHQDIGLIILDWNMPICNASQAIAAIREFEKHNALKPINIVILSAHDQHSAKEMNFPADIQLLNKPVSMESLIRIIPTSLKP